MRLTTREGWLGFAFILPTISFFLVLIVYPIVAAVGLSFFGIFTPTLSGPFVGLDNYRAVIFEPGFGIALMNNFIYAGGTLVLQVVVGVLIALMLHRDFFFRSLARGLTLFPYLMSTVVAVLVWQWLLNDLYGAANHALIAIGVVEHAVDWFGVMPNAMVTIILIGTWKFFPFVVISVLARLQTIPEQLYEAAMIDGASPWARFWDVTLPQLKEVLGVVIVLRAIWDFKEFDLIYLLTGGGPGKGTETLSLLLYKEAFPLSQMGKASAVGVVMLVIMTLGIFAYFRLTTETRQRGRA